MIQGGAGMGSWLPVLFAAKDVPAAVFYRNCLPDAAGEVQTCLNRMSVKPQQEAELLPVILAFSPAAGYLLVVVWKTHNYEWTGVTQGRGLLQHEHRWWMNGGKQELSRRLRAKQIVYGLQAAVGRYRSLKLKSKKHLRVWADIRGV